MIVRFYSFAKRENSTKQPTGTGAAFNCVLKENTSVVSPTILIDHADQAAPSAHLYNYAYIPDFGRYYFIGDQRAIRGLLWEYSLTCDILATYKADISASTLYLLRCSSQYDGNIVDNYYPVKTSYTTDVKTVTTPWLHRGDDNVVITDGCFVLGIVTAPGGYGPNFGSIKYVALDASNLTSLITYLMDAGNISNENITIDGMSDEAIKSIIDPLQFIKSCQWCPVLYSEVDATEDTGLNIWSWYASSVKYKPMRSNPPYYSWSVSFTQLAKHPQAASRGNYLNTAPYTKLYALIPPFGLIELDTTIASASTTLIGRIIYDIISGQAILEIKYGSISGPTACRIASQVGVPIQLTQVYNDYIHAAGGVVGGVLGAIGSALTGNIAGAITGGISAIGSAADAMRPVVSSMGGNGGFSDLHGQARLYSIFYDVPAEDNAHVGRPLCANVAMSGVTGGSYCLAMDGDIAIMGTAGEQQRLKTYLEGGFFYE